MVYQIGVPPIRTDVLTSITGVDFYAWSRRERQPFQGIPVWFIGSEDLLRNMEAAGRTRDLLDAEELRLAAKLRLKTPREN
jgi:hypothetical protein